MDVNIKEAKTKMGALLDRSQKGEEVVIMRREKGLRGLSLWTTQTRIFRICTLFGVPSP